MSRLLFDQNVPNGLRRLLPTHDIRTAAQMGWSALENGALLAAAESDGFDVLITADQNLRYQQNLAGRRIAVLILSTNQWAIVRLYGPEIERGVANATVGSFLRLDLGPRAAGSGSAPEP